MNCKYCKNSLGSVFNYNIIKYLQKSIIHIDTNAIVNSNILRFIRISFVFFSVFVETQFYTQIFKIFVIVNCRYLSGIFQSSWYL